MTGTELLTLLGWLLLGCAIAAAVWLFIRRPAGQQIRSRQVVGADLLVATPDEMLEPGWPTEAVEYPQPLSFEERAALAARLTKRKPRLYWAAGYMPDAPTSQETGDEPRVLELAMEALDNSWAIFCDLRLPGEEEAIDLLLVGPGGIVALEVVSPGHGWRLDGSGWHRLTSGGDWVSAPAGPAARLQEHVAYLESYLRSRGIERLAGVRPVLLLGPDTSLDSASGDVEIWHAAEIGRRLAALAGADDFSAFRANRVVAALEQELIDQAASPV